MSTKEDWPRPYKGSAYRSNYDQINWGSRKSEYPDTLMRLTLEHTESVFREALLEVNGGIMPPDEELSRRGKIVIDHEGVKHLLWDAPVVELGGKLEMRDMQRCIASVSPPKLFSKPTDAQ
jgi:hypothetical protein